MSITRSDGVLDVTKVGVIIEKPDGTILEFAHESSGATMSVSSQYAAGAAFADNGLFGRYPDRLVGLTFNLVPGVPPAEVGTWYEMRQHFADDKTEKIIFDLHAQLAQEKSKNHKLRAALDAALELENES